MGCTSLIMMRFNYTSTLVGHFMSSPREREKRDRRDNRREGQGRKRKRNESEETEEIKTFHLYLTCYKDSRPCLTLSQYKLATPVTYMYDGHGSTRPVANSACFVGYTNTLSQHTYLFNYSLINIYFMIAVCLSFGCYL